MGRDPCVNTWDGDGENAPFARFSSRKLSAGRNQLTTALRAQPNHNSHSSKLLIDLSREASEIARVICYHCDKDTRPFQQR